MKISRKFVEMLQEKGFTKHEIQNAWEKIKIICKKHQPAYLKQELTLQVMARDLLEGKDVEKIIATSK